MSGLVVFEEKKQSLAEIPFLQDNLVQTKIREIEDNEVLAHEITIWIAKTALLLGIKEAIPQLNKDDITLMIMTKFKSFSIDELHYAFKMERYGSLGVKTQHFQMFDAGFVSTIFEKYKVWKQKKLIEHNIQRKPKATKTATDMEKIYWINRGVSTCLEYFEENRSIENGKIYIYDILYDDGYLSKEAEFKREMYKEAQEVLRFEYSEKKASSRNEKIEFKNILVAIEEKGNSKVIAMAKELVLNKFFRSLTADETKLNEFKERYKN